MWGLGVMLMVVLALIVSRVLFYKGQSPLDNLIELIAGDGAMLFRWALILLIAWIIANFI